MKFFETSKYYTFKKSTYILLRWIGIIGQLISINVVYFIFKFEFNFLLCNFIVLLGILSNFYLISIYKKIKDKLLKIPNTIIKLHNIKLNSNSKIKYTILIDIN